MTPSDRLTDWSYICWIGVESYQPCSIDMMKEMNPESEGKTRFADGETHHLAALFFPEPPLCCHRSFFLGLKLITLHSDFQRPSIELPLQVDEKWDILPGQRLWSGGRVSLSSTSRPQGNSEVHKSLCFCRHN